MQIANTVFATRDRQTWTLSDFVWKSAQRVHCSHAVVVCVHRAPSVTARLSTSRACAPRVPLLAASVALIACALLPRFL